MYSSGHDLVLQTRTPAIGILDHLTTRYSFVHEFVLWEQAYITLLLDDWDGRKSCAGDPDPTDTIPLGFVCGISAKLVQDKIWSYPPDQRKVRS